jgi:hypothetical protein
MTEADTLDAAFLAGVRAWERGEPGGFADEAIFDRHARALFAYQIAHNKPYANFAALRGYNRARLPSSWRDIPAVPAAAFKDATLATFDVRSAELEFHTSGTTAAHSGKHYIERAALYDAALLAGFDRFMLADRMTPRFLNLVPNPRVKPHSSLGYMTGHLSVLRGDGKAAWFLENERLDVEGFTKALRTAISEGRPVCVMGTAFAFVALLDAFDERDESFEAPVGSRIMETGGFKGRSRTVTREALYARLETRLGIPQHAIVAEYGMTELTSQYYDAPVSRDKSVRVKSAPPWLRTLVVDWNGHELHNGEIGFLRHIDLGNRSSVLAIETEDHGYAVESAVVLLGRDINASLRGCSLSAEEISANRPR